MLDLHSHFEANPHSVPGEWARFIERELTDPAAPEPAAQHTISQEASEAACRAARLIESFRRHGHLKAKTNALKSVGPRLPAEVGLELKDFGFEAQHGAASLVPCFGFLGHSHMKLCDLYAELKRIYCGSIGFEVDHLIAPVEKEFILEAVESPFSKKAHFGPESLLKLLEYLALAEGFEEWCHKRYITTKRYALQGCDVFIPLLKVLTQAAADGGVKRVVLGMTHRGRINVLANVLEKPVSILIAEFEDNLADALLGGGDHKYHLGWESSFDGAGAEPLQTTLLPNASHLESIYPIALGYARSCQDRLYESQRAKVLPLLVHGDAAISGQGVAYECLQMARVPGAEVGGSVHIVLNNQLGYTTEAGDGRSSRYATDLAKTIEAPVFHVDATDVEAACWLGKLALSYRQRFGRDVVIELIGWRQFGHNEMDEPSYTQPLMYAEIRAKAKSTEVFAAKLEAEGLAARELVRRVKQDLEQRLNSAQEEAKSRTLGEATALRGRLRDRTEATALAGDLFEKTALAILETPPGFEIHPKLKVILERRAAALSGQGALDWATAEILAFASLLNQGTALRLSGQDVGRGTFSQRHVELVCYKSGKRIIPLNSCHVCCGGSRLEVCNTILSEGAAVGFEVGYGLAQCGQPVLNLWEAQFGDFANNAQVYFDQYAACAEAKWGSYCGTVFLLPHGYEGEGAEHSSARIERFLQLCAEGSMSVCYPSTAAQYFHLLRRQAASLWRRPVVIFTPKGLLRAAQVSSPRQDFMRGSFQPLIADEGQALALIFVSGKVYFEALAKLREAKISSAKLVRMEELYPFPAALLNKLIDQSKAKRFIWLQEEPKNMGAWSFMLERFSQELGIDLSYVGRPESAVTASAFAARHAQEQEKVFEDLFRQLG
jgi:2-oxoglutarate dehydrogenase E1 component